MESADAGATSQERETELREQALERIKRKRKFRRDVVIYVLVNAGLWVIWAIDGAKTDDVWPAWVSGIWGALLCSTRSNPTERPRSPISRSRRRWVGSGAGSPTGLATPVPAATESVRIFRADSSCRAREAASQSEKGALWTTGGSWVLRGAPSPSRETQHASTRLIRRAALVLALVGWSSSHVRGPGTATLAMPRL